MVMLRGVEEGEGDPRGAVSWKRSRDMSVFLLNQFGIVCDQFRCDDCVRYYCTHKAKLSYQSVY